jgi:hypothetical protein
VWKQIGREKVARARKVIAECEQSGVWPDYGEGIHYIEPPTYYVMQAAEQEGEAA